jgi:hypothetical protein
MTLFDTVYRVEFKIEDVIRDLLEITLGFVWISVMGNVGSRVSHVQPFISTM